MPEKSSKTSYELSGEMHWRRAENTGDKYLSGVLKLTINGQVVSVALTVFGNKAKTNPTAPDAYIYVDNPHIDVSPQDMTPDDIPF
jgi:hypothetical protein